MSILRLFPSKWLRGEDIKPDEIVTIKYVREELVGHDQESKPCIYFQEYEKGLATIVFSAVSSAVPPGCAFQASMIRA